MKSFTHEWILEAFVGHRSFFTKRMFGGLAVYLVDRQQGFQGSRVPGFQSSRAGTSCRFEDLYAWQLTRELERGVYTFTAIAPASKDLDYCRQIRKSSSSAPSNIAEGFGRYYPGDFARFTRNALASLNETRNHLSAGFERNYLTADPHSELTTLANRAIGTFVNLVKYLDGCKGAWSDRRRRAAKDRPPEP